MEERKGGEEREREEEDGREGGKASRIVRFPSVFA